MKNTYSIPAREVVPGMRHCGLVISHVVGGSGWPRLRLYVRPPDLETILLEPIENQIGAFDYPPDQMIDITLPGPSPRELCPELADRLQLWPAPFDGEAWTWNAQKGLYHHDMICSVWPKDLVRLGHGFRRQTVAMDEAIVTCFYLPEVTP